MCVSSSSQYKASKEGTVMGVAVSKISMLTHCQALTQACNYCEGQELTYGSISFTLTKSELVKL